MLFFPSVLQTLKSDYRTNICGTAILFSLLQETLSKDASSTGKVCLYLLVRSDNFLTEHRGMTGCSKCNDTRTLSTTCTNCGGTGWVSQQSDCTRCHGTGNSGYDVRGRIIRCDECAGRGRLRRLHECYICHGHGRRQVPCDNCR